ncbi:MAG: 50S ribosomal protein L22 [Kiritimatiellia bacterium]
MRVKAVSKYVRIAPSKARPLARLLRGVSLDEALKITRFSKLKSAGIIGKTLKSAIANVSHNAKTAPEDFRVAEVIVEQGPTMKRFWARSRGMVRPLRRTTSHIRVVLEDGKDQ